MANLFIKEAALLGYDARLYSFELDKDVPIASVAKVIIGGKWSDPDILDQIHKIVLEKKIDILLPFVDGAVEVAAEYCRNSSTVWTPASSPEISRAMFDKVMADELLRAQSIPLPRRVTGKEPDFFPVIAKPRTGSASKGIKVIHDMTEWRNAAINPDNYIVQEYIDNRKEYTLDCYIDSTGHITAISPRLRIEVVGGEVSRTVTVDLPQGIEIARNAIKGIGLRGAVTVQLIEDIDSGRLLLMEINPRLGGGAVCSVYAGVNLPQMIINDWRSYYVEFTEPKLGVEMTRYMQEVVFDPETRMMKSKE